MNFYKLAIRRNEATLEVTSPRTGKIIGVPFHFDNDCNGYSALPYGHPRIHEADVLIARLFGCVCDETFYAPLTCDEAKLLMSIAC